MQIMKKEKPTPKFHKNKQCTSLRTQRKSSAAASNIMSPNTKSYLARDVAESIWKHIKDLCHGDEIEVITLPLKRLGLKLTTAINKNKSVGRKIIGLPIRKLLSNFWHHNCTPSTTSQIQSNLNKLKNLKSQFSDTVTKIVQHKITHYMNHWLIINETIKML